MPKAIRACVGWRRLYFAAPITATLLAFALASGPAMAAAQVVASIKPVHSLVAAVMAGAGEPALLVRGGGSPHSYSLRPSEARSLSNADLVFWIGESLEGFLAKPLKALTGRARVIALGEAPGVTLLAAREGGAWEGPGHGEPGREAGGHGPDDSGAQAPAFSRHNPHVWLDPNNARHMAAAVVEALAERDPANAARYRVNGAALQTRLEALDAALEARLRPVRDVPFIVFHDAYPYLEARYGLNAVGSITVSPDRAPGAKRLSAIRRKIHDAGAACVFSEPQFQPALVETIVLGTPAKTGVLDPLGAGLAPGPETYFELMRNLAGALTACLTPAS